MKKVFIGICLIAVSYIPEIVIGQITFLSIGPELALPAHYNQSHNNRRTGFGGSIRLESSWSKHVSGIATVGYLSFAKKSPYEFEPTYTNQINEILIQLGIKYYAQQINIIPNGLFFSGEAGCMPTTNHIIYTNGLKQNFKENGLSIALGTGYQYKKLESSFRLQYNLIAVGFHVYYYNFRIAYSFLKSKG